MNSTNSGSTDPNRLFSLIDKINLKRNDKYVALSNLWHLLYMEKCKKVMQKNKFKIPATTLNGEIELLDVSYSASDIQNYFEYLKKTWRKDR